MSQMTRKDIIEGILIPILPIIALLLAMLFLANCTPSAANVACQVIKAVDDACTLIEVMGDDGKVQQVPVTKSELQGFARDAAAKRAGEARDAGAK